MMIKLYLWAKSIHRLFLYLTSFLVLFMSITGILLKYSIFKNISFLDLNLIRSLHNDMSIYIVVSLGLMMTTGVFMYIFPLLRRKNSA